MRRQKRFFCVALCTFLSAAGCEAVAPSNSVEGRAEGDAASGMRVYRDPETGEYTSPPPGAIPTPVPTDTHEGLHEEPSPVEGGGVMVDTKGRFLNNTNTGESRNGEPTK